MLYELHLTTVPDADIDRWARTCDELAIKPLVIELEGGEHPRQVMMAATYQGTDPGAFTWSMRIQENLVKAGFPVVRAKMEVPLDKASCYSTPAYHEAHVKCLLSPDEVEDNLYAAEINGWAASRNALYPSAEGLEKWYFTQRMYDCSYLVAGERLAFSFSQMPMRGTVRLEKETVITDTCPGLDEGWLWLPTDNL